MEALRTNPDDRIRINHPNCPDGEDTKRRLYIERKDYGTVAHCFNCGGSNFIPHDLGKDGIHRKRFEQHIRKPANSTIQYPGDYTSSFSNWSKQAQSWISQYGITGAELAHYRLGYSSYLGGIIFPLYNNWGVPRSDPGDYWEDGYGYVMRFTDGKPGLGPKYSFHVEPSKSTTTDVWSHMYKSSSQNLIICEDIVSGIKAGRLGHSIALLRTTISLKTINYIYNNYNIINHIYIHLDNDNPTVRKHSRDIYNRLKIVMHKANITVIKDYKDPKHYSVSELTELYQS